MGSDVKVPRLLRIKEVAKLTGLETWRLDDMLKRPGEGPPSLRIGKTIRVPEDALVRWIEERSQRKAGQ